MLAGVEVHTVKRRERNIIKDSMTMGWMNVKDLMGQRKRREKGIARGGNC